MTHRYNTVGVSGVIATIYNHPQALANSSKMSPSKLLVIIT